MDQPLRHMLCRAPTSATTCSGTQTGAQLSYDNERRLTHWQNTPSNPTTTSDYRYDGEGNRVAMQVTSGGTTTTTYYLGGMEEQTGTTLTKYYSVPGLPTAMNVGGTFSYLASDSLSSVAEALDSNGNVTAQQLFLPYGGARYNSGTMPTSKGFTGQRGDAATGLDYYNARYYDPALGQFASADSVADGLNRYAYVKGNPETEPDPTGHMRTCMGGPNNCGGSGGDGGSSGSGSGSCHSDGSCGCYSDCGGPVLPPLPQVSPSNPPKSPTNSCGGCKTNGNTGGNNNPKPQPDWLKVAQGTGQLLVGMGFLSLGIAGLVALLSNPELLTATGFIAGLFGGSPFVAFSAIFASMAVGLSMMVHGFANVLSGFNLVDAATATILTSIELVIDSIATGLVILTALNTAVGMGAAADAAGTMDTVMAGVGFNQLFGQLGVLAGEVNNLVADGGNGNTTINQCSQQPNQSCPVS